MKTKRRSKFKPLRMMIGGKLHVISDIDEHTEKRIDFRYKDHSFEVWLDEDDYEEEDCRYYIIGLYKDGRTVYDGWADEENDTLLKAVEDALRGSLLVTKEGGV